MTNRERLIQRLQSEVPLLLLTELRYQIAAEHDGDYDIADAFLDALDVAESNQERALLKECRAILIGLGYYVEMTQDEISQTQVSRGTVWDFKIKGVAYRNISSLQEWLSAS